MLTTTKLYYFSHSQTGHKQQDWTIVKNFFLTIDHSLSYKLHFKRFSSYKNVKLSKNKTLFYKIPFFRDKEILNHFMIILIYRMDIFKYLNQFSKYLSTYLSIMDQSTIFLFVLFSSPTDQQKMRGNFCLCHPVYKELPRLRGQQA